MKKKILIILIALPLAAFFLWEIIFTIQYYTQRRTPEKFILPDDYNGWVLIEWNNPFCPELQIEADYRLYPVTTEGYFCTKSLPEKGWATNWYHFKSSPQRNIMQNPKSNLNRIWHEHHYSYSNRPIYTFYVGNYKLNKPKLVAEKKKLREKVKRLIQ